MPIETNGSLVFGTGLEAQSMIINGVIAADCISAGFECCANKSKSEVLCPGMPK